MTQQYDLFGDTEAAEARRAARLAWDANPQTCPACGRTEPSGYLLRNNHGFDQDGRGPSIAPDGSECIAMYLTRNHVLWAASRGRDDNRSHLPAMLARAREVWADHLDELHASLIARGVPTEDLEATS